MKKDYDFEIKVLKLIDDALNKDAKTTTSQTVKILLGGDDGSDAPGKVKALEALKVDGVIQKYFTEWEEEEYQGQGTGSYYQFARITSVPQKVKSQLAHLKKEERWETSKDILRWDDLKFDSITGEVRCGKIKTKLAGRQAIFLGLLLKRRHMTYEEMSKALYINKRPLITPKNLNDNILKPIKHKLGMNGEKSKNENVFKVGSGGYLLV